MAEEEKLHDSIVDIIQDLQQPTITQASQSVNTPAVETPTPAATPKTEEPAVELSAEMLSSGADLTIGFFDFSQASVFTWLVKRRKDKKIERLYGEGALDKLERLMNEQDMGDKARVQIVREFTNEEMAMLRIGKQAAEVIDGLRLTENEKDLLKVPLMEIMKKRGGTIPPEYLLLIGLLQISGARVAELVMI